MANAQRTNGTLGEQAVMLRLRCLGYVVMDANQSARNHPGIDLLILTEEGIKSLQVKTYTKKNHLYFGSGSKAVLNGDKPMYEQQGFRPDFVVFVYRTLDDQKLIADYDTRFLPVEDAEDFVRSAVRDYFVKGDNDKYIAGPWNIPLPDGIAKKEGTRKANYKPHAEKLERILKPLSELPFPS